MKIACLLVAAPVLCVAADANALTAAEKKAGWELLFDGKTMNGWEAIDKKTPAGDSWTIEDGTLKSVAKPKLREDLFTAKKYGDFELVFEWKVSKNGNSGLKYRVQDRFYVNERRMREFGKFENLANDAIRTRATKREEATQEYVVGFEYQVIDNGGHPDARRGGYYQAGALYGMIPPVKAAEKPVGEWNQARVVVRGMKVEHWLNGEKVVDGELNSAAALEKTAQRWTTESPIYKALAGQPVKECPITLQNHGDEAWFRGIKIRALR
jgi:hypothetical protein